MGQCTNCKYQPAPFGLDSRANYEIPKGNRIILCLNCFKRLGKMEGNKRNKAIIALVQRTKNG